MIFHRISQNLREFCRMWWFFYKIPRFSQKIKESQIISRNLMIFWKNRWFRQNFTESTESQRISQNLMKNSTFIKEYSPLNPCSQFLGIPATNPLHPPLFARPRPIGIWKVYVFWADFVGFHIISGWKLRNWMIKRTLFVFFLQGGQALQWARRRFPVLSGWMSGLYKPRSGRSKRTPPIVCHEIVDRIVVMESPWNIHGIVMHSSWNHHGIVMESWSWNRQGRGWCEGGNRYWVGAGGEV